MPDGQDAFPADLSEWRDTDGDGVGDNADARPEDPTATGMITWSFEVPVSGGYEIWVNIPGGSNRSSVAKYSVNHDSGSTEITVDQRAVSGEALLGTWNLSAAVEYAVTLVNGAGGFVTGDKLIVRRNVVVEASSDDELAFEHADHLGSPQTATGVLGEVLWANHYAPHGDLESSFGSVDIGVRFPGQLRDNEIGYSYNYFRYYDQSIGRYVGADPIGLPGGFNAYVYTFNSPVNATDPMGLKSRSKTKRDRDERIARGLGALRPPELSVFGCFGLFCWSGSEDGVKLSVVTGVIGGGVEVCEGKAGDTACQEQSVPMENPKSFYGARSDAPVGFSPIGRNGLGVTFLLDGRVCFSIGPQIGIPFGLSQEQGDAF